MMENELEITLEIPDIVASGDTTLCFVENSELSVSLSYGEFIIAGNNEGLKSLAAFFMGLAQEGVPDGSSIRLTDKNGLSKGSLDLMIIKKE
jgi:hypothetical protein